MRTQCNDPERTRNHALGTAPDCHTCAMAQEDPTQLNGAVTPGEALETKQLLAKRDSILGSLRDEFKAKVTGIQLRSQTSPGRLTVRLAMDSAEVDAFLRDLANNIAQGLA